MRTGSRTAAGTLAMVIMFFAFVGSAQADRAFDQPRYKADQPGNIAIIGNTVLTCQTAVANCTNAQNGASFNNNDFSMVRVDIDGADPSNTSSSATLSMPSGASVLWAGLYWFASAATDNTVKLQGPGQSGYTDLTSDITPDTSGAFYSSFKDVTDIVSAGGNGAYTVADVNADTGVNEDGGWSLVVVYGDATQPPRDLSVFDGLVQVSSGANATKTITVKGFTTPPNGSVKTSLGVVSQDGDRNSTGDSLTLNSTGISDAANPANNVFNSTITSFASDLGGRTPNYNNQLGMDADIFNADGIIGNLATNATIKLTTGGETYLPNVVTSATELYAPVVVPDKTVTNVTHPSGPTQPGDTLRYTLSFTNNGQDAADGYAVTDPIPAGTTYKPGTLSIGGSGAKTDASGDDQAEFAGAQNEVRFRLGTGANATTGGSIAENGGTASATFDVVVDAAHSEGDVIANRASSDYRGHTVGTPFLGQLTPETRTIVHVPDLTISKVHAPPFTAGSNTTFTIVASNVGVAPTDGSTTTVTDTFPSGAAGFDSISNAAGNGWDCSIAGLVLTCTRSDVLPATESYPPIFVDAHVHDPTPATITNQATISGGGDLNSANNTATDSAGATALADVQVTKRTTTPQVSSGGPVEWIVDVHNAGPSTAANVTLTDTLSGSDYDQIVVTPTQGSCDTSVSCNLGSIVPGGTASMTIHARVLVNNTTLNNSANATSTTSDPDNSNNTGQATVGVENTADVRIAKDGGPDQPAIGDPFTYTISVDNDGPGTATGVEVTDQLPAKLGSPSVTAPGWTCNSPGTGGLLTCTLASLAPGSAPDIQVSGTILGPDGGFFFNDAAITTSSKDPNPGNNTASTTDLATPAADLAVTKSFDSDPGTGGIQTDPVDPGDPVQILFTIANNGPTAASNVTLHDAVPANLTPTAVTPNADCTISGNDVDCGPGGAFASLANSGSITVTVDATVNLSQPAAGVTVQNTVDVDSDTFDPLSSNNTDRASLTITPAADLSMTKTVTPTTASVGDDVTFTLLVHNAGPGAANGVSVSDTLPAGLAFVSASAGCSGTSTVTCAPAGGTLAANSNATFTITATIQASIAGQRVHNTATVTTTTPHDPDPSNNTGGTDFDVNPRADLELQKTAADPTPAIDADDTFTLSVTNHGPNDAQNVTIDDPVPAGLTFISASQGCQLSGTTVHCALGTVAANDTVNVTVTLRAGAAAHGQAIANLASVSSPTEDPDPQNNNDSAGITVGERVDLHLTKTVAPSSVQAGQTATFTLVVTNDGPSDATGVTLNDPLQSGLEFVSANPSQGSCAFAAGTVSCALGTVPSGGNAQVQITVRGTSAVAGQSIQNTASVSSNEPEARSGDNTAGSVLGVTAAPPTSTKKPKLSLTKTTKVDRTRPGAVIGYRITVRNMGGSAAKKVKVCDRLPAQQTVERADGSSSLGKHSACWTINSLAAGAKRSFPILTRVLDSAKDGPERNNATAKAKNVAGTRKASAVVRVESIKGGCPSRRSTQIKRYC